MAVPKRLSVQTVSDLFHLGKFSGCEDCELSRACDAAGSSVCDIANQSFLALLRAMPFSGSQDSRFRGCLSVDVRGELLNLLGSAPPGGEITSYRDN